VSAQETNELIVSVVSSRLGAFEFAACMCSKAVNFRVGTLTFAAVSGSTMSTVSSTSTAPTASSTVAMKLGGDGGPHGCISEFCSETGCSFFF